MSKPLAVVAGVTGLQGGSVVRHLLKDGSFSIRAITRNPASPAAQALTEKGVEVVKADLNDVESLKRAVEGAEFVFGVTNFWEPAHGLDPETETRQGKNLVDVVSTLVRLKLFVWSTLDDSYIPHFKSKAVVDSYLKTKDIPHLSLYTSFYYENLRYSFPPTYSSGTFTFTLPLPADSQLPCYSVTDTGGWVVAAFKDPSKFVGTDVKVATEWLSPKEFNHIFVETTGEKAQFVEFDTPGFEAFAQTFGKEVYLNMKYFVENKPSSELRDIDKSFAIYPEAKRWKDAIKDLAPFWDSVKNKGD